MFKLKNELNRSICYWVLENFKYYSFNVSVVEFRENKPILIALRYVFVQWCIYDRNDKFVLFILNLNCFQEWGTRTW